MIAVRKLTLATVFMFLSSVALAAEETYTVSFNDSDIEEVIRFVADVTEKNVVIDPRVKGKVKVISKEPLTKDELYNLLLSVLELHGFSAYDSNNLIRVVPVKEVRSAPVPVSTSSTTGISDAYITEVIVLSNISAAKVLPVIRPLVPQHAHMAAYDPSNSIVISDTAANIARVKSVIAEIDRASIATTEIIQLDHIQASDAKSMIDELNGEKASGGSSFKVIADMRTNSLIVSGADVQRRHIRDLVARIDRPKAQTGNVRVIYLEYADAPKVAEVLGKLIQNMEQATGGNKAAGGTKSSVEADESTNSLIITAQGDLLASMMDVIERLDIRRAQVLVEAVIAEIEDVDGTNLGVQWLFADSDGGFGSSTDSSGSLGPIAGAAVADEGEVLEQLGLALSGIAGQTFGFGDIDGDEGFLAIVRALQQSTNSNILSTPSLLTTDNHEATISVGQEVPFVTGSFTNNDGSAQNPFQTIERNNVGISLKVTPHINEGDMVVMDIEQEISSLTGETGAADVITNERSIKTQVLAKDGQVIILGGLMRDNVQTFDRKVPLLGSIPVVGRLFRSSNDQITKTNLLVFIRSTVIRDDETLTGTTAEKYRYLREQQIRRRDGKNLLIDNDSLPVIPGWPIAEGQSLMSIPEGFADKVVIEKVDDREGEQ